MRRLTISIADDRGKQASEQQGAGEPKPFAARSGSISPLERRFSRGVSGRKFRGAVNHRSSNASIKSIAEQEEPPSTTALRLRALAHVVRARHSLGFQRPAERKYLLEGGEVGTEGSEGVNLLMAGIQTKLKEDIKSKFGSKNRRENPEAAKVHFSNLDTVSVESVRAGSSTSQTRKPSLRPAIKSATMAHGSITKANLQHGNSIRGDLNAMIRPYEAKPRGPVVIYTSTQNLDARLTCAHSLYKLSRQPGSELAIIDGGAIAQIADFSDTEDSKLLRYSAVVLVNITTDLSVLEHFTAMDGVSAILELSWAPVVDVKVACITALCRLSQNRARAALLVRHRAITELMSMLTIPHVPLQQLAVSCIVNLIFHGHTFPDRVFMGDPHAVQSPLGLMNVVSQLSASPPTSQLAVETLFNLSLHRPSCLSALRGGGAEILFTLVNQLCKLIDGSAEGSSSRFLFNMGVQAPAWTTDLSVCMNLLRLAADTLANFSVFVEYHSIVGSQGIKALNLLLVGALRDVGNVNASVASVERFRCTSVSCSRCLVNFSSNIELRRQNFPLDLIHLTTKLALMDHQRYVATASDARMLLRNSVRALCNLSFEPSCRFALIEISNVFTMLNAVIVLPAVVAEEANNEIAIAEEPDPRINQDNRIPSTNSPAIGFVSGIEVSRLTPAPIWYLQSSLSMYTTSFPWTTDMSEDSKEDALITLLNLAQEAASTNEMLRTLDGKLLAAAAEDQGHSRRLRYIYDSVLSNLLFDSYLQQVVFGDQVIRALVSGFNFFETSTANGNIYDNGAASTLTMVDAAPNVEKEQLQALNLAFDDDQERFLASIFLIANELMDMANIELVVALVLPCMRTYMNLTASVSSNMSTTSAQRVLLQRQLPIICYASASLFALTRAATQRRDTHTHVIHSEETEAMLIAVSALPAGSGSSGSSKGGVTQAFCAATLYHLCASTSANPHIMQGLIHCCNANEEAQPLLACSAAFAITSFTAEGCQQLVECADLARALNRLGRTSHVECQQYAAIAACNVSTVACVWSSAELKDFIVVALLRANSIQTKQIHAKTLSNLLSHGDTRSQVIEDGVLYALMKLSQVILSSSSAATTVNMTGERRGHTVLETTTHTSTATASADEIFGIGLRALFNLSCDHQYHSKLVSNGIMGYLSAAVECQQSDSSLNGKNAFNETAGGASFLFREDQPQKQQPPQHQCLADHISVENRRLAISIICNLSSYEENHRELIRAQVTETICNYVDSDAESRVSAAMALRNLSCRQPWVEMLCERNILQLLISCAECDHPVARQFAVEALANCSLVTDSLHLFGEMRVPRAMITLLEVTANDVTDTSAHEPISWEFTNSQNVPGERVRTGTSTYMAALKCLLNIAHDEALALVVMEEKVILRLLSLIEYRALGTDVSACELAASLTHTLAGKAPCAEALLRQRTVSLCSLLHRRHATNRVVGRDCVRVLMLLSTYQPILLQLSETQAVHVVVSICGGSESTSVANPTRNLRLRECGAVTIRNLTLSITEHQMLFYGKRDEDEKTGFSSSERESYQLNDLQNDENDDNGNAYDKEMPVSLMLERHMLHGIKYFQAEIASGQTSDRILLEASAAIANLSTVKVFRVAMVRLGVIQTLLQVMNCAKAKSQRVAVRSTPVQVPAGSTSPLRLRSSDLMGRICAATLHRLVVEDEAAIDPRNQLVPSLLSVLRQSDEDLQQVRYECEKISFFSSSMVGDTVTLPCSHGARRLSHLQTHTGILPRPSLCLQEMPKRFMDGHALFSEANSALSIDDYSRLDSCSSVLLPAGAAAATLCVRHIFREQRWMVYLLKTILSSQAMIPHLEKKQMRTMGLPKLCFQDITPTSIAAAPLPAPINGSSSSRSTSSSIHDETDTANEETGRQGYVLPVNMEKHAIRRSNGSDEIVPMSVAASLPQTKGINASNSRPIISGLESGISTRTQAASMVDPQGHTRKFNRQMQLSRRNNRRDASNLPPV